jgi:hypothetical protein
VAAFLWPNEELAHSYQVGDRFVEPLVGWTQAAASGTFSVRIDTARIPQAFVGSNGQVNVHFVAWDDARLGDWTESVQVTTSATAQGNVTTAARVSVTGVTTVDHSVIIGLDKAPRSRRLPRADVVLASRGLIADTVVPLDNRPPADMSLCIFTKTATDRYVARSTETHPRYVKWGAKVGSSHTQSVDSAFNGSSVFGNFNVSGSYSTTSGVTITHNPTTGMYNMNLELQYGRWREDCLDPYGGMYVLRWAETVDYPTGGGGAVPTAVRPSAPSSNCITWTTGSSGGSWDAAQKNSTTTVYSTGVVSKPVLGINLGLRSSWSSTSGSERSVWATTTVARSTRICGNDNVPTQSDVIFEP